MCCVCVVCESIIRVTSMYDGFKFCWIYFGQIQWTIFSCITLLLFLISIFFSIRLIRFTNDKQTHLSQLGLERHITLYSLQEWDTFIYLYIRYDRIMFRCSLWGMRVYNNIIMLILCVWLCGWRDFCFAYCRFRLFYTNIVGGIMDYYEIERRWIRMKLDWSWLVDELFSKYFVFRFLLSLLKISTGQICLKKLKL